ncbi:pantetheine-phosphate adenylyltransferase [Streptococcus entericus]|uniref:pantetheine-phosphate adenylyltransferase n=1 Tax=Streptococcus entericus TaxID=155680 RepID=UPI00036C3D56|nr:pantetheine-phosphate adenylyltransferase [Streptococcus entericus]
MSGKVGLFTGSFDPMTLGHRDVIERASQLFDQLYVGLFYNQDKVGFLPIDQRLTMLEQAVADLPNVKVITSQNQLAVEVARQYGVTHLVRGLRDATDFAYEENLSVFNHQLAPELETVFLLSRPEHRHLSSSRVRELIHFKQDISRYVPANIITEMEKNNGKTEKA